MYKKLLNRTLSRIRNTYNNITLSATIKISNNNDFTDCGSFVLYYRMNKNQ